MKKEEILERSRAENIDEGEEFVQNKSQNQGIGALSFCYVIIWLVNLFYESEVDYMLTANILVFAYFGASCFSQYKHSKNKIFIFPIFLFGTLSISTLMEYIFLLVWDLNFIEFLFSR